MEEKSYKEYLEHISTFIFDVDGVLTDGSVTVTTTGEMLRKMNIKDGYGLKTAVDAGFNVCIISGGSNEGVRIRLKGLGITDIYLGAHNKIDQLNDYFNKKGIKEEPSKEPISNIVPFFSLRKLLINLISSKLDFILSLKKKKILGCNFFFKIFFIALIQYCIYF